MALFVTDQGIDPQAQEIISYKARRLVGKARFTVSDLPDIEQEMLAKLSRSQHTYDPKRAKPSTFVKTVAESQGANLVRNRQSRGRSKVVVQPLDRMAYSLGTPSRQREHDLQLDVQEKVAQLSAEDQGICRRLQHLTLAQAARALGVPRSTLQDKVRRIGHQLRELGLES